jgi:pyruvate-ferredoxin/flavodoxin oxidoreductase
MRKGLEQQKLAVQSGYWPLYRYNPALATEGRNPMTLDSKEPTVPLDQFEYNEVRFRVLRQADPERASMLLELAREDVMRRWSEYEQIAAAHVESGAVSLQTSEPG